MTTPRIVMPRGRVSMNVSTFATSLASSRLPDSLASFSFSGGQSALAHQREVQNIRTALRAAGLPTLVCDAHIIPVLVGDPVSCRKASEPLLEHFQLCRIPDVPRNGEGRETRERGEEDIEVTLPPPS
jgi:5-aminolevulinate synthase